ncbi:hypothetical protein Nepgr_006751 [Nepenthes gracilis]|uniref:Uncharacterized protein n=1 Tax=Nepenthes gracilis TaxID=150966 RepID=A0AAD3S650_NEPGR|nr:hypothetical protein Nepgr_006751 [Nepenthes gracilis]
MAIEMRLSGNLRTSKPQPKSRTTASCVGQGKRAYPPNQKRQEDRVHVGQSEPKKMTRDFRREGRHVSKATSAKIAAAKPLENKPGYLYTGK